MSIRYNKVASRTTNFTREPCGLDSRSKIEIFGEMQFFDNSCLTVSFHFYGAEIEK